MLRFLELLCKELGAIDARLELGGRDPDDPRCVFVPVRDAFRLVVVFAEPPPDAGDKRVRLRELAESFSETISEVSAPVPPSVPAKTAFQRLDAALEGLRSRVGAVSVIVVDVHSPVLWGTSDARRPGEDVTTLVQVGAALRTALDGGLELDALCAMPAAEVPGRMRERGVTDAVAAALGRALSEGDESVRRHHLLTWLALARSRTEAALGESLRASHHEAQFGYVTRGFANIYLLIAVFEGAFSELYVESAVLHALPGVEQLTLALPPLDPDPASGGRVIRLRRQRG
jgi:hypothetical protein